MQVVGISGDIHISPYDQVVLFGFPSCSWMRKWITVNILTYKFLNFQGLTANASNEKLTIGEVNTKDGLEENSI